MEIVESWDTESGHYAIVEYSADYLEQVVSKKFEAKWVEDERVPIWADLQWFVMRIMGRKPTKVDALESGDVHSFRGPLLSKSGVDFDTLEEARDFLLEVIGSDEPLKYKGDDPQVWIFDKIYKGSAIRQQ